jgi:hypothetical protein
LGVIGQFAEEFRCTGRGFGEKEKKGKQKYPFLGEVGQGQRKAGRDGTEWWLR